METFNIIVEATLPTIFSNFEAIKSSLEQQLQQFELIVQEDDVKVAKENATSINKLKGEIDTLRKNKVKELSAPINELDRQAKELVSMCENTRQGLLSQVATFEDKKREECLSLLKVELKNQYERFNIQDEFQKVEIADLAIISNLNKGGLAKKAVDTILCRILEVLKHQKVVEDRLLELKGYCLEAGLEAPLTKEHVSSFLMMPDCIYHGQLNKLIESEIKRIAQLKSRLEEAAKKEAQVQASVPSATIEVQKAPHQPSVQSQIVSNVPSGTKRRYIVTATFEIEVDESLESKLEAMLQKKFAQACFKTVPEITVVKQPVKGELMEGSLF